MRKCIHLQEEYNKAFSLLVAQYKKQLSFVHCMLFLNLHTTLVFPSLHRFQIKYKNTRNIFWYFVILFFRFFRCAALLLSKIKANGMRQTRILISIMFMVASYDCAKCIHIYLCYSLRHVGHVVQQQR